MSPEDLAAAAAQWDEEAETFDREADHGLGDPDTRAAWRDLLRDALPTVPGRVADLGCGTGTLSVLLAEDGWAVDGLDVSPRMLERARAKASGLECRFVEGDAAAPVLPAGEYDAVVARHVLWALPDPASAVARWVALLRPEGVLVLVEGDWHTGAGLAAARCEELVREHRVHATVSALTDPLLWGGPVEDERYLLVSDA